MQTLQDERVMVTGGEPRGDGGITALDCGRRPALLVFETRDEGTPAYFIALDWRDDRVAGIRDFRFARYGIDGAEVVTVK